ncbi:MAG TPA: hypothetical protein VNS09_14905 [Solirubrobacter sp.]|nr:hypothetical protein [Solirubrobacter sp.]
MAVALAIGIAVAAWIVLARLLSPRAAIVNAGVVLLLGVALALEAVTGSAAFAAAAFGLAAFAWLLRWVVNAASWLRGRTRPVPRRG